MAIVYVEGFDHYSSSASVANEELRNAGYSADNAYSTTDTPYNDGVGLSMSGGDIGTSSFTTPLIAITGTKVSISLWMNRKTYDAFGAYGHYAFAVFNGAGQTMFYLGVNQGCTEMYLMKGPFDEDLSTDFLAADKLGGVVISHQTNVWQHYCFEVDMATDTTGRVQCHINGAEIFDVQGIQSSNYAPDGFVKIRSGYNWYNVLNIVYHYDDLVVMDGSGDNNTRFLGIMRVVPLSPTADYQISPSSVPLSGGDDFAELNQVAYASAESSYTTQGTEGEQNLYSIEDVATKWTGSQTILGVQVTQFTSTDAEFFDTVANVIGDGTNVVESGHTDIYTSKAVPVSNVFNKAPDAGDWSVSKLQATKIGHKLISRT